jgi:multidrug efflux pump
MRASAGTSQKIKLTFYGWQPLPYCRCACILSHIWIVVPLTERFQKQLLPKVEEAYKKTLAFALRGRNPYIFFGGTVALLLLSFVLLVTNPPKTLFFPINQPNLAMVYIELPIGTDIEETNKVTLELENKVRTLTEKYTYNREVNGKTEPYNYMVESIIAQVGEGTSDPNQGPSMAQTPNKAKITVAFREFSKRVDGDGNMLMSADVLEAIRKEIGDYPGVQIVVDKDEQGPPAGAPINIEVEGDDYIKLVKLAQEIKNFVNESGIAGIEELKLDVEEGKPEMPIEIDRAKARALGISTAQIGQALRTALFGREVSRYKEGEDDYPINVRFTDEFRYNLDDLMNQKITFRDQSDGKIKQVPISAVAKARKTSTFSAVKRNDLNRVVTLQSNVLGDYNPTEVNDQIKAAMKNFDMPAGYTVDFTGEQEEQAEQVAFLSTALVIAVFLIFLILVAQFNSASTPFIILITVILSLIGVLLGLVFFRMDFVIMMTMVGIISLAGIVVNNAIVLIDYVNQLIMRRQEDLGLEEDDKLPIGEVLDAIVQGGKTRLRPVLLNSYNHYSWLVAIGHRYEY